MSEIDTYWLRARLRERISEFLHETPLNPDNSIGRAYLCGICTVLGLLADITGIDDWQPDDFEKSGFRE